MAALYKEFFFERYLAEIELLPGYPLFVASELSYKQQSLEYK
jgi:hypothetical protein